MIKAVTSDFRGASAVERHTADLRAAGDDENGASGREQADQQRGREPEGNADRHQSNSGGSGAVENHGSDEERSAEKRRVLCDHIGRHCLDQSDMRADKGVSHPGNAQNADDAHKARLEDGARIEPVARYVAEHHDQSAGRKHHDLQEGGDRDRGGLVAAAEFGQQRRVGADENDSCDAEQEDEKGAFGHRLRLQVALLGYGMCLEFAAGNAAAKLGIVL